MVEYAVVGWKEKLGVWEIEVCITEKKGQSWWGLNTGLPKLRALQIAMNHLHTIDTNFRFSQVCKHPSLVAA